MPTGYQSTWSADRHSMICHFPCAGVVRSKAPITARHSPVGSRSITSPSPVGQYTVDSRPVLPLSIRTPGSIVQLRSSVDTAENTCQP